MVRKETRLNVADNSGAKEVCCIHVVGGTGKKVATVGDIVRCSVKRAIPGGKVKKKDVVTGVIVRVRKEVRRSSGEYIRFGDNAIVLIQSVSETEPIGTRVSGPVARELRIKGGERFSKILSLATEVW